MRYRPRPHDTGMVTLADHKISMNSNCILRAILSYPFSKSPRKVASAVLLVRKSCIQPIGNFRGTAKTDLEFSVNQLQDPTAEWELY
jgi:formate-dependent phosphoribosylglycinamide formyltransferase (GAR transformylase)